jgi:type IV pilus assembly protein PilC
MPYFKWRGVTIVGDWRTGRQFAPSHQHLDAQLLKKQIALIESVPVASRWFLRSVSRADTIQFFRQLSVLIQAGILLPEALAIAGAQLSNPRLQEVVYAVADAVQGGNSFGDALQRYPKVFSKIMVQLVQAGEESGKLAPALQALSDHLEATHDLYSRIRAALMMPVVTFLFFCAIVSGMFVFILPRFEHIFASMKVPVPPLTRTLLSISAFMRSSSMLILLGIGVLIIFSLWLFKRTTQGKNMLDAFWLKVPFAGGLLCSRFTAYFFHSVGMLLEGGMPLVPALSVVRQSIGNVVFAQQIAQVQKRVDAGESLSDALAESDEGLFSPEAIAMVLVGQESSSLPMVLKRVAAAQREQIRSRLTAATALVQPLLMVLLGLLVALLIFAIYTPIFNLSYAI